MKFSYKKGEGLEFEMGARALFAAIGSYAAARAWRNPIPAIIFGVLGWKLGESFLEDKEEEDGNG